MFGSGLLGTGCLALFGFTTFASISWVRVVWTCSSSRRSPPSAGYGLSGLVRLHDICLHQLGTGCLALFAFTTFTQVCCVRIASPVCLKSVLLRPAGYELSGLVRIHKVLLRSTAYALLRPLFASEAFCSGLLGMSCLALFGVTTFYSGLLRTYFLALFTLAGFVEACWYGLSRLVRLNDVCHYELGTICHAPERFTTSCQGWLGMSCFTPVLFST